MSLYDYRKSLDLVQDDPPFYALLMAAMRQADTDNLNKLCHAFPWVWNEFQARYHAPGGVLRAEEISLAVNSIPKNIEENPQ